MPLDYLQKDPATNADAVVIWLHGLGADGHDFFDVVPMLRLAQNHRIRFMFPHAPDKAVTINGGMMMPAWYDILSLDRLEQEDEAGLKVSEHSLHELLNASIASGIPSERHFLFGFSQGGALALYTALRYPHRLGGVAALSCYLPMHQALLQQKSAENQAISIFMAHGQFDSVVPYQLGYKSYSVLAELGYDVEWHAFPMAHEVCVPELEQLGQWISNQLK